jgi:hypothetical protein
LKVNLAQIKFEKAEGLQGRYAGLQQQFVQSNQRYSLDQSADLHSSAENSPALRLMSANVFGTFFAKTPTIPSS